MFQLFQSSRRLSIHAHATIDDLLERGQRLYVRERDLPRLCPMLPGEALANHADLIARLKRALMRERRLGSAGHWSYDLMRHMHLAQALRAEEAQAETSPPAQTKNAAPDGAAF